MRADRKKKQPGSPAGLLRRWSALFVVAGLVAALFLFSAYIERAYAGKIVSGVRVGDEEIGGLGYDEALKRLESKMHAIENEGIQLRFAQEDVALDFTVTDASGIGLTVDVLNFDPDASAQKAYAAGRSGTRLAAAIQRVRSVFFKTRISPSYIIDEENLGRAISVALEKYEHPAAPAAYARATNGTVSAVAPKSGEVFDVQAIAGVIRSRVNDLSTEKVPVALEEDIPAVSATEAATLIPKVKQLLEKAPLKLHAGEKTMSVKSGTLVAWLEPMKKGKEVTLGVNVDTVAGYLKDIAPQVGTPAKEPKFRMENGKVAELTKGGLGSTLDIEATVESIRRAIEEQSVEVELAMKTAQPQATEENISELGIVELVAEGRTNFWGSPPNRRHNIAIAADLLNGLLIPPGAEFSTIQAVGPVDATLGYLQEMVIKEDRTIPEYGGGLCQIGTTMFRLAMNAGLPILERQNHSYRVRYYEPPAGMDATIYEPKPDFRFKNDYAGYLLLQTRIEGDDLIFEFWGKKDGRTASTTTPRIYNIVPAPEQKTVETTDLPPGTVKCTEKAHIGSDAEFTYTVTYADGKKVDKVFKSHYKPWRAVCLVGVKEIKKKDETKTNVNANTNANANTGTNTNTPST